MRHDDKKIAKLAISALGSENAKSIILWGHGWGQTRNSLIPLAESLPDARHVLFDFPGFGESESPENVWGTQDYADCIAAWIKENIDRPVIWAGHSFGGRVGIQLGARHPELIQNLYLIASAGLRPKRPLWKKIYLWLRIRAYKFLKALGATGMINQEWLFKKFGARDHKLVDGVMRKIFVRVVNEDLSAQAQQIKCPVTLVYGTNDTEAPPEIGKRLSNLIPDAKLVLLNGHDHYSVLSDGRHQVLNLIKKMIKERNK